MQPGSPMRSPGCSSIRFPGVDGFELAQVNVARLRAPLDDPAMRGFVDALEPVHRIAEAAPGFVWRLATEGGHGVCVVDDAGGPAFCHLSIWQDYPSLHAFAYRGEHGRFVRARARWFVTTRQPSTALWWVRSGTRPTVDGALRRLRHLRDHGPEPRAFGVRRRFTPDGRGDPCAR